MAVDTEQKRASATHFLNWLFPAIVIPDGTIDASDRQAAVLIYSGIAASSEVSIWSTISEASPAWAVVSEGSEVWSVVTEGAESWTQS